MYIHQSKKNESAGKHYYLKRSQVETIIYEARHKLFLEERKEKLLRRQQLI